MATPDIVGDKRALRARLRRARAELDDRAARQARLDLALLAALPRLARPPNPVVAFFSALAEEASPSALADPLRAEGAQLVFPRVEGDRLVFRRAESADLVAGTMGILEPTPAAPAVELSSIDLFIVPGLGFTPQGHRIGYGRGLYDRALSEARRARLDAPAALTVGVGFSVQVIPELPVEPHDVPLERLVTEAGYVECGDEPSRP